MNDEERIRTLEEAQLAMIHHVSELTERVVALESGWEVVGEAARKATKRLLEMGT